MYICEYLTAIHTYTDTHSYIMYHKWILKLHYFLAVLQLLLCWLRRKSYFVDNTSYENDTRFRNQTAAVYILKSTHFTNLYVLSDGGNSREKFTLPCACKWYVTRYAKIYPFGSSGTSHIMRAVVNDTSGNDTFEGAPGAEN